MQLQSKFGSSAPAVPYTGRGLGTATSTTFTNAGFGEAGTVPGPSGPEGPAQPEYTAVVRATYPSASLANDVMTYLGSFIQTNFGYTSDQLLLGQSICSDDANAPTFANVPSNLGQSAPFQNNFLGPFFAGGIGGYPHTGTTAMIAWASHYTDGGALVLVEMPHIGITADNDLGFMYRKGQTALSATCGAVAVANSWVSSSSTAPTASTQFPNNYQQYTLTNILYPYKAAIQTGSFGQQMQFSTEIIRVSSSQWIINNIPNLVVPVSGSSPAYNMPTNVYYFCGTFINTDYGYQAYINPNTFQVFDISLGASGSWVDYTTQFLSGL
jgi:hypothetical protein